MSVCCGRAQSVTELIARVKVIVDPDSDMTIVKNAQEAIDSLKLAIALDIITDISELNNYGAKAAPAIILSNKVISEGVNLSAEEIAPLIRKKLFAF